MRMNSGMMITTSGIEFADQEHEEEDVPAAKWDARDRVAGKRARDEHDRAWRPRRSHAVDDEGGDEVLAEDLPRSWRSRAAPATRKAD